MFPGDRLQAIGSDEQLHAFGTYVSQGLIPEDTDIEKREMKLHRMVIRHGSPFIGKSLRDSGIREHYDCMVVGVEEGQQNLTMITPTRPFEQGDVLWVVGEGESIARLLQA